MVGGLKELEAKPQKIYAALDHIHNGFLQGICDHICVANLHLKNRWRTSRALSVSVYDPFLEILSHNEGTERQCLESQPLCGTFPYVVDMIIDRWRVIS